MTLREHVTQDVKVVTLLFTRRQSLFNFYH